MNGHMDEHVYEGEASLTAFIAKTFVRKREVHLKFVRWESFSHTDSDALALDRVCSVTCSIVVSAHCSKHTPIPSSGQFHECRTFCC